MFSHYLPHVSLPSTRALDRDRQDQEDEDEDEVVEEADENAPIDTRNTRPGRRGRQFRDNHQFGCRRSHSHLAQTTTWYEGIRTEMDFEQTVYELLGATQDPDDAPRRQAEEQLHAFYANTDFPVALCKIATLRSVGQSTRQASTVYLKNFILAGWSPELEGFKGQVLLGETTKNFVKENALQAALSDELDRKTQHAFAYIVSRIASVDYPDAWPELLPKLMDAIDGGNETSLHGALRVLSEVVEDGLDEGQFFMIASTLVNTLHRVSIDVHKTMPLRALAVSVFRGCFDMIEMVLEGHKKETKAFAEDAVGVWMPFLLQTLQTKLPPIPAPAGNEDDYKGLITLKLQVMKTLMRIRLLFPSVIAPQSQALFQATWDELLSLQPSYQTTYIKDQQDGRLENSDGLPYTLDFLVLEDLDFLQACIRAPQVRKALESQLQQRSQPSWIVEILDLAVPYSQITIEEEGIWQTDVNVFLSEETSVTANYTTRTACGDLVIKLGEWLPDSTMQAFLVYMRRIFSSDATWQMKEGGLCMLGHVLTDWQNLPRHLEDSTSAGLVDLIRYAIGQQETFLRARGYLLAGLISKSSKDSFHQPATSLLDASLPPVLTDSSEIVRVSCIRAVGQYVSSLPTSLTIPRQASIITTLSDWLAAQDPSDLAEGDDLMMTLVETLRDTLLIDIGTCIDGNGLSLLFSIATIGASNIQIAAQTAEVWEEVCAKFKTIGAEAYAQLCLKVLPSLTGAFNVGSLTDENALLNLAAELLASLTEHAPDSLPPSFVPSVLPKILPILMVSDDGDLLKYCTIALRYLLQNDASTLLSYRDPSPMGSSPSAQKSGLECTLLIIERLLGPSVDDIAASEVGHLASALVSAASGTEQLVPHLTQLLQAVAMRLASATQASLIQSLILVFSRLCLTSSKEVIDFLANINIGDNNGLHAVLPKWLEDSGDFAGYDEIRTNTIALARIYELHDSRLEQVPCKGELIIEKQNEGRIMTRSRAKQQGPEQWTSISANVKIVKVLVAELIAQMATSSSQNVLHSVLNGRPRPAGTLNVMESTDSDYEDDVNDDDDDDDDGEWEDEPGSGVLDLGLGATKADLMALGGEESSFRVRQPDGETQIFLVDWFKRRATEQGFDVVFNQLNESEREKLRALR